jgi:nicotinamide-nucleotide amidase
MSRDTIIPHKIALLATGDEIVRGDILNTNCQEIALRLANAGMEPGLQAITPDVIKDIEHCIRFLLSTHQALIITGGLGPTSDDLTRYALANYLNRELVFDNATWDTICARLNKFGIPVPPDSNRQQALFPEGAITIPNPNGTAAGCYLQIGEQFMFMLPGPPLECLPMVDTVVLKILTAANFPHISFHKKWLLFGASEGKVAEELDAIAKPFDCLTGYRLWHPYLEFKIYSSNEKDFNAVTALLEKSLAPYLLGDGQQTTAAILQNKLISANLSLEIADYATGGALQSAILTPETFSHLSFSTIPKGLARVEIQGLKEYWQHSDATLTSIELTFFNAGKEAYATFELPFRGKRVIAYAVQFICHKLNEFIDEIN